MQWYEECSTAFTTSPTTDVRKDGDRAIKRWIDEQMKNGSCTVVLIGTETANRKWINYEIAKSWNDGMGVVGIHIHGLKDQNGYTSPKGVNPFQYITLRKSSTRLSSIVKCYSPQGSDSKERYAWISQCLAPVVEAAIEIRKKHGGSVFDKLKRVAYVVDVTPSR